MNNYNRYCNYLGIGTYSYVSENYGNDILKYKLPNGDSLYKFVRFCVYMDKFLGVGYNIRKERGPECAEKITYLITDSSKLDNNVLVSKEDELSKDFLNAFYELNRFNKVYEYPNDVYGYHSAFLGGVNIRNIEGLVVSKYYFYYSRSQEKNLIGYQKLIEDIIDMFPHMYIVDEEANILHVPGNCAVHQIKLDSNLKKYDITKVLSTSDHIARKILKQR